MLDLSAIKDPALLMIFKTTCVFQVGAALRNPGVQGGGSFLESRLKMIPSETDAEEQPQGIDLNGLAPDHMRLVLQFALKVRDVRNEIRWKKSVSYREKG